MSPVTTLISTLTSHSRGAGYKSYETSCPWISPQCPPSSPWRRGGGGQTGEALEEAQSDMVAKFMDGLQKWTVVGRLQQRRYDHSVIENANNQILVVGGNDLR